MPAGRAAAMLEDVPDHVIVIVPAALGVLPVALVVGAIVAHRARLTSVPAILVRLTAVAYGAALVATTLFPFRVVLDPGAEPSPNISGLIPSLLIDPRGLMLNTVLFVPLGVLLSLLRPSTTWRRATIVGLATSLAIELVQFAQSAFLGGSRAFDVDDLLANTLGALVGYGLYRLAGKAWQRRAGHASASASRSAAR